MPRLAALTVAAASLGLALLLPVPAQATGEHAKRGQPCTTVGATGKDRSGDLYTCEQRPGDLCPVWHARYPVKHPGKGPWPSRSPVDCPGCPSTPPSVPASSAPPSTPPVVYSPPAVTPSLPVTGGKVWVVVAGGAALLGIGALIRWAGRRRVRTASYRAVK